MKNKFLKCCLVLVSISIVTGCASSNKHSKLLVEQKHRIKNLEKDLARKEATINKMKAQRWTNKPVVKAENLAFRQLRTMIKNKQWTNALKESSSLKTVYPRSKRLHNYRVLIFEKMGLRKQAIAERKAMAKLNSRSGSQRSYVR